MIDRFKDEYRWLSNFHPCQIELDGKIYPSVEHAYQASKTVYPDERDRIREAPTPGIAKKMGSAPHRTTLRMDWEDIRLIMMYNLVMQKFYFNRYLRQKLLATGSEVLVEGNDYGDTFWGVCKGKGQNNLGVILMYVRGWLENVRPELKGENENIVHRRVSTRGHHLSWRR